MKPATQRPQLLSTEPTRIELKNPERANFEAFIAAAAHAWEVMAHNELVDHAPHVLEELLTHQDEPQDQFQARFHKAVREHAPCQHVVVENSAKGQHLVLCGAGPSLKDTAAEWCPQADQIWGCNSALIWLHENGYKPTHGFSVDQTPAMLKEWYKAPDVHYLLATTCHPHLTEYLLGRERTISYFFNFVGIAGRPVLIDGCAMSYENWLYASLFPTTVCAGSGLNSVNRAIDVALYMGFEKITVLGADCALRTTRPKPKNLVFGSPRHRRWLDKHTVMHADGGSATASGATMVTMGGEIDGVYWETKPDLVVSAVYLEKTRQKHYEAWYVKWAAHMGRKRFGMSEADLLAARQWAEAQGGEGIVRLVGDTLPVALRDKPDAFLKRLPTLQNEDGSDLRYE